LASWRNCSAPAGVREIPLTSAVFAVRVKRPRRAAGFASAIPASMASLNIPRTSFAGLVKKVGPKRPEPETQEFGMLVTFFSPHVSLYS